MDTTPVFFKPLENDDIDERENGAVRFTAGIGEVATPLGTPGGTRAAAFNANASGP